MKDLNLPEAVARYFEADLSDGMAVARCFTNEGVVTDEGQTYSGSAAIAAWKTASSAKFSYIAEPLVLERMENRYVVTGRVTGDFPGGSADLQYIFTLAGGKIEFLEITP